MTMTTKVGIPFVKPWERLVAPPGSEPRNVLQERPDYIDRAVCKMITTSKHLWWDDMPVEFGNFLISTRPICHESQTIGNVTEPCVRGKVSV